MPPEKQLAEDLLFSVLFIIALIILVISLI
jgi:hypothetical protein